ncbi:MEDIATOR OF RNA polymerase II TRANSCRIPTION SUBUNIT [Salix viminalis]|uniref:MEDIATOR OF RNA polymerase II TRANSCRIPTION SUBUNIT n=1 Tax=Salix viminalis TaxID=40686 RepID=A0A9Q0QJ53_SALVM|nr:MEDIATOR OF RNA polymerase II TRANSCRIPTION SUBUNIT [Salix viminalis]
MGSAVLRSSSLPSLPQKPRFGDGKRPSGAVVAASRRENPREWMMGVDESMVVLRKRIHEMKMLLLMNTRPGLALGMLLLMSMSVPVSMVVIARQLVEATFGVFSTVHGG